MKVIPETSWRSWLLLAWCFINTASACAEEAAPANDGSWVRLSQGKIEIGARSDVNRNLIPPNPAESTPGDVANRRLPVDENPLRDQSKGLEPEQVVPGAAQEYPLDLSMALRLAETENPTIAIGREAIREAMALHLQAQAMVLPDLNAGVMYHKHTGALQESNGEILNVDLQSLYAGGGDRTFASQTVLIPAIHLYAHVGDAYFAPLAAAQVVNSRSADSRAIANQVLLDVTDRYLDLLQAEAEFVALRTSEGTLGEVLSATAGFAQTGQGRLGDYHRARAAALLLHARVERAQEGVAAAAAALARRLHLDPSIRLTTGPGTIGIVELVDRSYRLEELIDMAQRARPESAARDADIAAAELRLQQECLRPCLPLISVGLSAGGFGGGSDLVDSQFQRFVERTDVDVFAVWTLDNLGLGNLADQKERRAQRDDAIARRVLVLAQIGREVADAYAARQVRAADLEFARKRLKAAEEGAQEEINRTRGGQGLPLEAINSVELLTTARDTWIQTLIAYNRAEFQLFVAVGETPSAALPDPQNRVRAPAKTN